MNLKKTNPYKAYLVIACGTTDCDDYDAHTCNLKKSIKNPAAYIERITADKRIWIDSLHSEIKEAIEEWLGKVENVEVAFIPFIPRLYWDRLMLDFAMDLDAKIWHGIKDDLKINIKYLPIRHLFE